MRTKLLLLLLCAAALATAQTLVGLPPNAVTLAGNAPIAVDHTGRGILGYVLHRQDVNGNGPVEPRLRSRFIRLGVPEPEDLPPGQSRTQIKGAGYGPTVKVSLEAVVFMDGEYVTAEHSTIPYDVFPVMELKVNAEKNMAQMVAAARDHPLQAQAAWESVAAAAAIHGDEGGNRNENMARISQQSLARDLLAVRSREGEQAAYDLADRSAKLPAIWRKK